MRHGREYDWLGHHVAVALAMIYLFLLPLVTAPKDWAFAILTAWTLIRLPHTWRCYGAMLRMPLSWMMLAWVAWQATSFLWSHDLAQAWDELKVQRMLVTPLLLWPILDRAPWLVMAALAGVMAQNGVQVMQEFGWLSAPATGEGRLRGLLHPIHSAMWMGAAALWHLSAALNTGGWKRAASMGLLAISAAGLVATGSRGPWIAAAITLPAALLVIPLRRPATRHPAMVIGGVCVACLALTWILGHSMIKTRLQEAQREIDSARQQQVYWTSAGLRLGLWGWALEVWRDSPIIGVGAGGFPAAYQQLDSFKRACENAREQAMIEQVPGYAETKASGRDVTTLRAFRRGEREYEWRLDYLMRGHAHSTYLHNLASGGAVGLALVLAVLLTIGWQCLRDRPDYPYSDAMFFVLLSWAIGAQFDCYELNGHQLGLLMMVAALTLPGRAKVRWQPSAIGD